VISNRSRIEQITPEQQAVKQKEEAAEQERKRKEAEANAVEQNRAAVAKAAEDKRIEESNKKWFDTLRSAALDAMLIDPHLKYEFGIFHPLDLTLSSLNAATASRIANQLCSTYHLSGGLRVYLADGHLAAQCEFLPDIKATTTPADTSR